MSHSAHNATVVGATACEMSMLWNWKTVDTCFLSESWHVTNRGMFAASCIGVAFLAVANEGLRRLCREYDHLVMRQLGEIGQPRDSGTNPLWFIDSYTHGPPRATPFQQLIRTVLHVMSVGVGYILMLVLMSFNGYTFVSILIGTGIGKFFCDWLTVGHGAEYNLCAEEEDEKGRRPRPLSAAGGGHHH